jgi:predicted tellurium resistance membrane protein TerC
MRDIAEEDFTEFKWMPFVIGGLGLLILRGIVIGTIASVLDVTVLFVYFGAFSLWSFGYKLYRYGHDLAPTAAVRVDPFMPPMFGYQQIANFEVYSYPQLASYAMGASLLLLVVALAVAWRGTVRERRLARVA